MVSTLYACRGLPSLFMSLPAHATIAALTIIAADGLHYAANIRVLAEPLLLTQAAHDFGTAMAHGKRRRQRLDLRSSDSVAPAQGRSCAEDA